MDKGRAKSQKEKDLGPVEDTVPEVTCFYTSVTLTCLHYINYLTSEGLSLEVTGSRDRCIIYFHAP